MSRLRIIARHILPNTMSFVIVAATISVPGYILGEVVLSFLGVGVQEPSASWGNMLNQARSLRVLTSFPWLLFAPGHRDLPHGAWRSTSSATGCATRSTRARCMGGKMPDERAAARRCEDLQTHFFTDDGVVRAVDGVSFEVRAGETLGDRRRVGLRQERHRALDPAADRRAAGPHRRRRDPVQGPRPARARRRPRCAQIRGKEISMIFQEPMTSLNPVYTFGEQIIEALRAPPEASTGARRARARSRCCALVGIPLARAARRRVPAPDVGRHAPARDDRHGARLPARDPDRRRADHRARRHHPGADPRAAEAAAARSSGWR